MSLFDLFKQNQGIEINPLFFKDSHLVEELNRLGLAGDFYFRFKNNLDNTSSEHAEKYWIRQTILAEFYKRELEKLGLAFLRTPVRPIILKGLTLQSTLYDDWGQRPSNDIDLLIDLRERRITEKLLKKMGYEEKKEVRWRWNNHKSNWVRTEHNVTLEVELHWNIFPTVSPYYKLKATPFWIQPFRQLALTDQLVYLMAHAGHQHNFSRLFWLIDIDRYLRLYKDQIDGPRFKALAQDLRVTKVTQACFALVSCYLDTPIPEFVHFKPGEKDSWSSLISEKYLLSPHRYRWRYFFLKHYLKETLFEALKYDFMWVFHYILRRKIS